MSPKLSFKSKHLIKSFFNHDKYNTKIAKYTINILKKFYKQIQTSKEHIKNIDLKSSLKIVDYIIKPVNFSYMEKEVQNNIIQTLKITATYTIRIYNKYVKNYTTTEKLT